MSLRRRLRNAARRRRFVGDLRLLHDTLAGTGLRGRYWVRGGLLLGWARERRVLPRDNRDADFGFLLDDAEHLRGAVAPLRARGFEPWRRYRNNAGRPTEYVFKRGRIRFEFIGTEVRGDRMEYFLYAFDPPRQLRCEIPAHGLAEFDFLGRRWLKPDRHDAYLAAVYGDWRTPDAGFRYTQARSIVERVPWTGTFGWSEEEREAP